MRSTSKMEKHNHSIHLTSIINVLALTPCKLLTSWISRLNSPWLPSNRYLRSCLEGMRQESTLTSNFSSSSRKNLRAFAKRSRLDLHSVIGKQRVASESSDTSLNATSLVFGNVVLGGVGGAGAAGGGGKAVSKVLFLDLFVGRAGMSSRSDCDDSFDEGFSEAESEMFLFSGFSRWIGRVALPPLFRPPRGPPRL